jgi:hypothetical protein
MDLKQDGCKLDPSGSGLRQVAGSCEHSSTFRFHKMHSLSGQGTTGFLKSLFESHHTLMIPVGVGSLLTAWHTRLVVTALADVQNECACSSIIPLSKKKNEFMFLPKYLTFIPFHASPYMHSYILHVLSCL